MYKRVMLTLLGISVVAAVFIYIGLWIMKDEGLASYQDIRKSMGVAALAYVLQTHAGNAPTTGETVTIDEGTFKIIDMCQLVDTVAFEPDVLEALLRPCADTAHDNCELGPCNCHSDAHYIWLVDPDSLKVYSTCVGDDCAANNQDGYQGVWP